MLLMNRIVASLLFLVVTGLVAPRSAWAVTIATVPVGNAGNAADVIAAGADGVAVISALSLAPDPETAAQELRAVVDAALERRVAS